jgi:hypothetical protein
MALDEIGVGLHAHVDPVRALLDGHGADVGARRHLLDVQWCQQLGEVAARRGAVVERGGPLGHDLRPLDRPRARHFQLDHAAAAAPGRVHRHRPVDRQRQPEPPQRAGGEGVGRRPRLGVAVAHGVDHLVGRAGADRVVGGVAHDGEPGLLEEGTGPVVGGHEQRAERLGPALEGPLGGGGRLLDVDPVRRGTGQQVGPGPRTQLAPHLGGGDRCRRQVVGQRRDPQGEIVGAGVGLGHDAADPGLRHGVVGPGHPEQGPAVEPGPELVHVVADAGEQDVRVGGHAHPVVVAGGQVLGPHRGAVEGGPGEGGPVDRGGHAPPHHRVLHAGEAEELRHLGHVTEHVGEVAHLHGPAELGRPGQPDLEVAHDRLAGDEELVHEHVPRADRDPSGGVEAAYQLRRLRPHGQVVVHHRQLAVEQEVPVRRVVLEGGEEPVEELDEALSEGREGGVPLPIPVGVGDDGDGAHAP